MKTAGKPVLIYSYAAPSAKSRAMLRDMGLHCYTSLQGCVHGLKALVDGHLVRVGSRRLLQGGNVTVTDEDGHSATATGRLSSASVRVSRAARTSASATAW